MSDPGDLTAFFEDAWQHLRRGAADAKSPARYPVFATVAPDGTPEARTVALRRADRATGVLEVHTDTETPKIKALRANPNAALHVWLPRANLQIRVTARVEIVTGPEAEEAWARVPPNSRVSYGTEPIPGTPIDSVHAYTKPPRRDRFAPVALPRLSLRPRTSGPSAPPRQLPRQGRLGRRMVRAMTRPRELLRRVWDVLGPLLLVFLTLGFAVHASARGLNLWTPLEQAGSRLFHMGETLSNLAIYGHMITGGVLTLLAPLQMIGAVRRKVPGLHHLCGYVIALTALITAVGGLIYIARQGTIGGWTMNTGFTLYGALMLLAAVQTLRFARRRDPRHRDWALRLIVLALGSWLYRVHYGIWEVATGGLWSQPDFRGGFDIAQTVLFYLPYLLLLEVFLRRNRSDRVFG